MLEPFKAESEKLLRIWMQHDAGKLGEYLVSGVEDPRFNVQSILTRHFLLRARLGQKFEALMDEELRFGAALNWLLHVAEKAGGPEELEVIHYALEQGADNAEGIQIPAFILKAFQRLPIGLGRLLIPNYVAGFLQNFLGPAGVKQVVGTFEKLWYQQLSSLSSEFIESTVPRVLEVACGSANDYRYLASYGVGALYEYQGIDLCGKNITNARELFPRINFIEGNVFDINTPDKSFDFCFVHDLFEHLSLEGLERAAQEVCRVTRRGLCLGFFQMDERSEHLLRPIDDYYCNLLSLSKMADVFARHGFATQAIHIASFLQEQFECPFSYNPNAYTFILAALR